MKRKVVRHGSSSLTITLPVKWVSKFNIQKGDDLNVEETGPILLVSTEKQFSTSKKEVSTTDYGIFTKNNLSHLYQLGYDEIEIKFDDDQTLEEIKRRLPNCMGFEIIDQKENKVYIKSIATTIESDFDMLLRKAFLITNEMAKSVLQILEKGQFKKLKEIRNMESLNNKFTDICIRILNKRGYKVPNRTMQIYEIVKNLERIGDEFKHICDLFANNGKTLNKKTLSLFKQSIDYYTTFYTMFYKFDVQLKKEIYLKRKSIVHNCKEELGKSKGINSLFLHHIINIVEKTYDGSGGYFALIL